MVAGGDKARRHAVRASFLAFEFRPPSSSIARIGVTSTVSAHNTHPMAKPTNQNLSSEESKLLVLAALHMLVCSGRAKWDHARTVQPTLQLATGERFAIEGDSIKRMR